MARITKHYLREGIILGKSRILDILAGTIHFMITFPKYVHRIDYIPNKDFEKVLRFFILLFNFTLDLALDNI